MPPAARRSRSAALASLRLLAVVALAACEAQPTAPRPTWPVSPEPLPVEATSFPEGFGPASWALDPAYPAPGPETRELHILVWERACSSGSSATGRMSAPVVAYHDDSVVMTIKVRPLEGVQTCPGPPGTPAVAVLSQALRDRELLDGGSEPPTPPSPAF